MDHLRWKKLNYISFAVDCFNTKKGIHIGHFSTPMNGFKEKEISHYLDFEEAKKLRQKLNEIFESAEYQEIEKEEKKKKIINSFEKDTPLGVVADKLEDSGFSEEAAEYRIKEKNRKENIAKGMFYVNMTLEEQKSYDKAILTLLMESKMRLEKSEIISIISKEVIKSSPTATSEEISDKTEELYNIIIKCYQELAPNDPHP